MKIAVLGTGAVGRALSGRLAELGHDVTVGTRDPGATGAKEEYADWAADHPDVGLATFADAAEPAPVVINATSGAVTLDVLGQAGELGGKVVIDVSNGLDFSAGFPPLISFPQDDSMAEQVQRAFPAALVVKSLNTMTAAVMAHPEQLPDPGTVFLSGDDPSANETVAGLLRELGHTDILDLGDVTTARGVEWLMPAWLRVIGAVGTPNFNWKVVR
ncbi:NADPH-dependent F420 reductase [Nocardioides bizhenqiangii]|uniref:NAD(P)-binding domain-containing protein n=1 Tax=Nocardioides bizhenqiangii TaxID=3095076 RepID=A0ABZ0ZMF0_9ACTN|nr:NAD(P)-binding domain-containing protein [Nocardioides sp. HM61]WQQ25526.1 NAD(P)-binding domain-containing protein [Nocardioides sp. HM61]